MSKAVRRKKKIQSAGTDEASADFVNEHGKKPFPTRFYILLALLVGFLAIAWFAGAPNRLLNSFSRAALSKYDLEGAENWLIFAANFLPDNTDRELLLARIARKKSDYADLDKHLSRAIALGANKLDVQIEEAMAAAQSGALELVELQLCKWLESGIGEVDELSDAYANGLAANSRFENLNQVLDAWQKDYPADPRPDYRRARMREYFQDWASAEALYRKSLSRNPKYYPSRYRLGRVLILERKMEDARDQFELCAEMSRPEAAKTSLAFCYRSLGQSEEAKELLEEVMQSSPEEIDESYDILEESPEYFEAASALGDLESEGENYVAAEKWLLLALSKNDRDLQSRYSLAVTLRQLGRVDEAQKQFDLVSESRKALEQVNPLRNQIFENPKDPGLRLKLGELLLKYESERSGRFWINSVFSIDPSYRPAHEALAKYYRERSGGDSKIKALADYHAKAAGLVTP